MNILRRIVIALVLLSLVAPHAQAAVNVERASSENPMVEVSRSVIYGGLAGLVLGSAFAVASDGDNDGDVIRWMFFGGTMVGLAAGVWFVTSRPQPEAALEIESGSLRVQMPAIEGVPGGGTRVRLVSYRF